MTRARAWRIAYWALGPAALLAAVLNMKHVHAGLLTNHLADLAVPAWLYIVFRGLNGPSTRQTLVQRIFGRTPEVAALSLFVASTLTEVSQYYWPHGLFSGRFDVLDIGAYGVSVGVCYLAERAYATTDHAA